MIPILAVKKTIYIINRNNIKSIMIVFLVGIVFILLENKINLNLMTKYVNINIFVELQCQNLLEFNQYMKWDQMPYNIYTDIESVIK